MIGIVIVILLMILANTTTTQNDSEGIGGSTGTPAKLEKDLPTEERIPTH